MKQWLSLCFIIVIATYGCDRTVTSDDDTSGIVRICFSDDDNSANNSIGKAAAVHEAEHSASIDQCEVRILRSDNSLVTSELLTLSEGRYSGSITVKVQNDLIVLCIGRSSDVVKRVGLDDDVDVVANQTTTAVIIGWNIDYTPEITGIPASNDDGNYVINWSESPSATEYILEEADNQVFAASQQIYTGSNRQYIYAKKKRGTYYYRVKAKNQFSIESGWSEIKTITVNSPLQNYVVSGAISGADNVTVTLGGDSAGTVYSDSSGQYSFDVTENGSYTVTPSKNGYRFEPPTQTVSGIQSDTTLHFTAVELTEGVIVIDVPWPDN